MSSNFNYHQLKSHPDLKQYEESKTPVLLKNLILKENNKLFFNQQSFLHPAASSDVLLKYIEQPKPTHSSPNKATSVDVTVSEIPSLIANQRVNIAATITMGTKDAKQVMLKATHENDLVKEDCVIEDATGSIMANISSPLIDQVKDGNVCYSACC